MSKTANLNMLSGRLFGSVVRYTIPIMLTGILQLLFNAADLIIVGRFCGRVCVAAVGATGSLTSLIVNLFIGLSVGTGVTVAHALGAGDHTSARQAVHTALPVALLCGVVLTAVGVACSGTFLGWMGTSEDVLPLSTRYMQIYFAGIVFMLVYNFCAAILRAAGDTRSPLLFLTIAGLINVLLNVALVVALNLNVAGVALATTISQAISAILVLITLMRRTDDCRLCLTKLRVYPPQLRKMLRIGLPAGIQSSLFAISNVLIQSSINSFGSVVMSGNAAAQNIDAFVYVTLNAFHQTALNFVGQNIGARQYRRARQVVWVCLGSVLVTGLVLGSAVLLLGKPLLSIYIPDSPEAVGWGIVRLSCLCLPYSICGMMDVSTGALRGMGVSVIPMLVCILGVCGIRIAWICTVFQIPACHNPQWLYYSYTVSWVVTFTCLFVSFVILYRRRARQPAR